MDIVSCLPVSYITQLSDQAPNHSGISEVDNPPEFKGVKFIRLLRLGKLLRLARLNTVIKRHEEKLEGMIGCDGYSTARILSLVQCKLTGGWVLCTCAAGHVNCWAAQSSSRT
eukprot:COSAG02_NODE_124_length_35047_cov_31.554179_14_plen_113_part_00